MKPEKINFDVAILIFSGISIIDTSAAKRLLQKIYENNIPVYGSIFSMPENLVDHWVEVDFGPEHRIPNDKITELKITAMPREYSSAAIYGSLYFEDQEKKKYGRLTVNIYDILVIYDFNFSMLKKDYPDFFS
ncbi:hypothetical protein [Breoghania corrubedonensis]|uniref:hypothetical protein n=1 Tax=Breoghania corrubedonensis TaxID=665038 RepID=UPI0011B21E78|nr:hypothetical protein [Breoghania corrubedonensis]